MSKVTHASYKSYSGPRIRGSVPFLLPATPSHWEKVMWLTSHVESGGKFGSITMYDGTGATCGLHQAIAVYPKELASEDYKAADDQGSLFPLLRRLELVSDFPEIESLWAKLASVDWYVSQDGKLRWLRDVTRRVGNRTLELKAGDLVHGTLIRDEFTPIGGVVPSSGSQWEISKAWALEFFKVFSAEKGFSAQVEFGTDHFFHYANSRSLQGKSLSEWMYGSASISSNASDVSSELDLAYSVFWSHSVNAPSLAFKLIASALSEQDPSAAPTEFARILLRKLATSTYGRWHHTVKSGRWQRTREIAQTHWPSVFFTSKGLMPLSF